MTKLIFGVLLWSVVHLVPAVAAGFKKNIIEKYGENPYKGVFGLLMIFSLYLIISGWGSMTPVEPDTLAEIYTPPDWGDHAAGVLVLIGFILFLAPYPPNNIKRMLRHPQLLGMACWGVGHLIAIGTMRSIVLFGGFAVWAVLEMIFINRRDGTWVKPEKVSYRNDLTMTLFSVLAFMAFLYTHHLLFGGSPLT